MGEVYFKFILSVENNTSAKDPKIKCHYLGVCYRQVENFQETEWSAMTALEEDLLRLETELGDQFGGTNILYLLKWTMSQLQYIWLFFAMV